MVTISSIAFIFPTLMIVAAASDLLSMTISNKVPLLLIVAFGAAALVADLPYEVIGLHAAVALAVLLVTFSCFSFGWMGGGDAKLMAATALWFGPASDIVSYLLLGAIFGGALTLALVLVRSMIAPATGVGFVDRLLEPRGGIPYGITLGIAGLVVFADSAWMDLAVGR